MEFLLVDEIPFRINNQRIWPVPNEWLLMTSEQIEITREPEISGSSEFSDVGTESHFCQSLENSLAINVPLLTVAAGVCRTVRSAIKLQLLVPRTLDSFNFQKCKFQILGSGDGINIFEKIREVYGEDNVRVNMELNCYSYTVGDNTDNADGFEAEDLPIQKLSIGEIQYGYGCEMSDLNFPNALSINMHGRITIILKLNENGISSLCVQKFSKPDLVGGNKRLLEDAICSDLVIVTANKTEVRCHKGILAVRSDVFRRMLEEPKTKESITSVVEIPDMSEEVVRAFLNFLYTWDIKEASKSCDIAFGLLVAADKYNVSDLESVIAEFILFMPAAWFNVDMTVKLLIFAERQRETQKNKVMEQLQDRAIRVLKWLTKDSFDALLNSEDYQKLFRDSPDTAMKIHARLFSMII